MASCFVGFSEMAGNTRKGSLAKLLISCPQTCPFVEVRQEFEADLIY